MFERIRSVWRDLRQARAGRRFQGFYEAHAAQRSAWTRPLVVLAALSCFAVGVVLAVVPGPAVLFFALTAALTSTQSRWVARLLDRTELQLRHWCNRLRGRKCQPPTDTPCARE